MSDAFYRDPQQQAPGGGSLTDVNSTLQANGKNLTAILALLIDALKALFLPQATGSFTLGAAVSTVVPDTRAQANSIIIPLANNAAAATLMGSAKSLYPSARTVGVSFTMTTANGVAAAGTEQFQYVILNPVV